VNPAGIRRVFERRQEPDADQLQGQITRIRKVIQSYAMIPALKTLVAKHNQDPDWLRLRPPLVQLDQATRNKLLAELDELGFNMAGNGNLVDAA
jgi:4-hydroxy-tetrahydrodipicolinate synthase